MYKKAKSREIIDNIQKKNLKHKLAHYRPRCLADWWPQPQRVPNDSEELSSGSPISVQYKIGYDECSVTTVSINSPKECEGSRESIAREREVRSKSGGTKRKGQQRREVVGGRESVNQKLKIISQGLRTIYTKKRISQSVRCVCT